MERYTGMTSGKDYWGCDWTYEENIHACLPTPNQYLFTEIGDWKEKLHFPDLDAIDWKKQADIGVDAIDTLQACNRNLPELKKKYGDKITFCGGFDNMHVLDVPGVSTDAVKKEYRRVIDSLAPGGSYVIYPIGGTFDFVGPFLEEHFAYGMHFYENPANR